MCRLQWLHSRLRVAVNVVFRNIGTAESLAIIGLLFVLPWLASCESVFPQDYLVQESSTIVLNQVLALPSLLPCSCMFMDLAQAQTARISADLLSETGCRYVLGLSINVH